MRYLILLLILGNGTTIFSNQTLLLKSCKSSSLNSELLKSIDTEIYRAISNSLELDIIFSEDEGSPDLYTDITLNTIDSRFELNIRVIKSVNNTPLLEKLFLRSSITSFQSDIDELIVSIKENLRYKPDINSNSQIVIETSIPHGDIYIDGVFAGKSPVVIRKQLGDSIEIEARTESSKKRIEFKVKTLELERVTIEMEPIVGSMLLKGDITGRELLINGEKVELTSTALFKGLEIGAYDLYIESEWGLWEEGVTILEDTLIEVEVAFTPISRVDITLNKNEQILVYDLNNNLIEEIQEDGIYVLPVGKHYFESIRDEYISLKEVKELETEYLNRYISPELTPLISPHLIKKEEELAYSLQYNQTLSRVKKGALYGSVGVSGLLLLGIIGEVITVNLYNQSSITSKAIEYREFGEGLRILNTISLTTGILGAGCYFGVDIFRKEIPNG